MSEFTKLCDILEEGMSYYPGKEFLTDIQHCPIPMDKNCNFWLKKANLQYLELTYEKYPLSEFTKLCDISEKGMSYNPGKEFPTDIQQCPFPTDKNCNTW